MEAPEEEAVSWWGQRTEGYGHEDSSAGGFQWDQGWRHPLCLKQGTQSQPKKAVHDEGCRWL